MATCILEEFNIQLKISFYDVDSKLIEAMKLTIEMKEREKMNRDEDHSPISNASSSPSFTLNKDLQKAKLEFQTEEKNRFQWDEL